MFNSINCKTNYLATILRNTQKCKCYHLNVNERVIKDLRRVNIYNLNKICDSNMLNQNV